MQHRKVYSSDPKQNTICPRCKELLSECRCESDAPVNLDKITAVFGVEKAAKVKIITVISQLPKSKEFLKESLKELKQRCGTGGTFLVEDKRAGCLILQGDQCHAVQDYLSSKGIKNKKKV